MYMNFLSIISRYSRTFFERRLAELNIGFTEHSILVFINKADVLNQEQIAKHFMLDKGAVAKALNKLEEKNYITRQENPNNKREKLIQITEHGRSIMGLLNDELMEWHNCLFRGLSQDEIEEFKNTIEKVAKNAAIMINERMTDNEETE